MRALKTAILAGLLVAGCASARTIVSEPLVMKTETSPHIQVKKLNESLRLVLNNICSLSCGEFLHRNMTPEELYYALQRHLENYRKVSDEAMGFCKANKIEPCYVFAVEKEPEKFINILKDFKEQTMPMSTPVQTTYPASTFKDPKDWFKSIGIGDY